MTCMEPLAPDERSRLLLTLTPNGIPDDYIEVRLTRVVTTEKIELRQMRPNPDRAGGHRQERSIFLTKQNWDEIRGAEIDELPEVEEA